MSSAARVHYPATYRDAHGEEQTSISNDGRTLRMIVRGVEWEGPDFDLLGPAPSATSDQYAGFTLNRGDLCAYELTCVIPIDVVDANGMTAAPLEVELRLGEPGPKGGLTETSLRLTLTWGDVRITGSGTSGWFEDELLEIQQQLPANTHLRACINCQYSDYSPAGHTMFGDMLCLRSVKADYLRARTKKELLPVFARSDGPVQEIHVCDEFARRIPGTGYRG